MKVPGTVRPPASGRATRAHDEGDDVAVSADLAQFLDKEWEAKSLTEILKAPVSALAGVSDGDAAALRQAFTVKTVGDLGRNKFFRAAQALALLGDARAK